MDPSTLSAGVGIISKATEITDYIEYWQQYKNQRIDVRASSMRPTMENDEYVEDVFIIRGTVDEVLGQPAGFLLTDVDELHKRRKLDRSHFSDGTSDTTVIDATTRRTRHVDEKVVAFSDISELEITDVAEDADEEIEDLESVR